MFNFVDNTYSGMLSILSTLFGLSYPLVLGCIDRIDEKFQSTKLSERFMKECVFKFFKFFLVVNLVIAVLFPFLMDDCENSRLLIGVQCACSILLIICALELYSKILVYYNVWDLHNDIISDYRKAKSVGDEEKETLYFTQWVDLTSILLSSVDDKLVQSIYETLKEYVEGKYKEEGRGECIYDQYYYDGVSHINESLCKSEQRPMSFNNNNFILTFFIYHDSIVSDITYRYLWWNLRIQMFYNKEEWIMEYWKSASQKYMYLMSEITPFDENVKTGIAYTDVEIQQNNKNRENFLEFHIMLCAMLLQQEKYSLVNSMLSFTQTVPSSYPLVPSRMSEIVSVFNKINSIERDSLLYYENRYKMPNMHGITGGRIKDAANSYLALLMYRLYSIQWPYGSESVLDVGILPQKLIELSELRNNLSIAKFWLEKVLRTESLISKVLSCDFVEELNSKKEQYGIGHELLPPDKIIDEIIENIDIKIKNIEENQPLSAEKVSIEEENLIKVVKKSLKPYRAFLDGGHIKNGTCYDLSSSVSVPFPNSAFLDGSNMSYVNIAESMASHILGKFYHLFASSFYQEHSLLDYQVSSENLFKVIDSLELDNRHCVIVFGFSLDPYIGKVEGLTEGDIGQYQYKATKIFVLNCRAKLHSQMMYVMRMNDCPVLEYQSPSSSIINKYKLNCPDSGLVLYLSLLKLSENIGSLNSSIESQLGEGYLGYSLFTCVWRPRLSFNSQPYKIIRVKIKYRLNDEGDYDTSGEVKRFEGE